MMATSNRRKATSNKPPIVDLIPAAAYIRMSTTRQEDSPDRQRRQINEYATRHGYKVIRWYEDHGMTGTESANRADYQQLLSDSKLGAFSAVLIAELSRLSREDLFTVLPQWGAFRDAGITLVSCQRGEIDFSSMGGFLSAIIDQYSAHDESKKIADRSVSGKLHKTLNGDRVSGNRLFGFDRNIVDASGHVLKRVSCGEKFIKSVNCKSVLVPSADKAAVDAIQWAFRHVRDGGSIGSVVREFNRRKLVGVYGKRFTLTTVGRILTNPAYAGDSRSAYRCRGKFMRMSDTHEPILMKNTHAGLVDRETFDVVCAMIQSRSVSKDTWATYILSGLCRCGHCGRSLCGQAKATKEGKSYRYCCYTSQKIAFRDDCERCSVLPSFDGPLLERAVIQAWCDVFLADDLSKQLKLAPAEDQSKHEQDELKSLSDQIERAERNLTLAESPSDFKTVSTILAQMRRRETELREKLSKSNRKAANLSPEIREAIGALKDARTILEDWPNVGTKAERDQLTRDLAVVFKQTIGSIVIKNEDVQLAGTSRIKFIRRKTGVMNFNHLHATVPEVILTDEMLAHPLRRQYRQVFQCLKETGRVMTTRELSSTLGKSMEAILRSATICEAEGSVRRLGGSPNQGWIACDE